MSANTSKEMPAKVAQTSKASTPRSTSSNAASTKATSGTPGTTLRHQPAAQDPNQALSQRLTGPSGNTLLRGIGAWADPPGPNAGATTDSAIGGDISHQRNARELGPQSQPRSSNDQGLTPMERFRKEGRHDQPSGLLDGGKPQSEHGKGKSY
ncbi:hypothetical protein HO133_002408 [Letharia lupina]|uniref:Uncharacterized protein n=1 Tax=Letharia lupina TaxID=560253 RepID=A0A8H6CDN5_9LECA|nr:uncharacterized protein HO133_002408 [Letharia lupina]KAF6221552.1 hypothetical protein HO133_002408 [Letharia lupina]